jgi:hypothetical protein
MSLATRLAGLSIRALLIEQQRWTPVPIQEPAKERLPIENCRCSCETNWSIPERGDKSLFPTTIVMSARGSFNEPKPHYCYVASGFNQPATPKQLLARSPEE